MGKSYSCKAEVLDLMKKGVSRADISRDFDIPISTVCYWYHLEKVRVPDEFSYEKVPPYEAINRTEARIFSEFSPYLKDMSDEECTKLQEKLNKNLVSLVKEL